jgi:hypothetical protein
MREETKATQGFIEELRNSINKTYEMAIFLDRVIVERQERYFGVDYTDVKAEPIPDTMSGEMFTLLQRTMEMLERAHKYVLEV